MNDEKLVYQIERTEAARSGDFGYARGAYAAARAPATRLGHFMRVWRLEDGRWKLALDVASPLR
jgi:ketosteroid isomerase-like protein